MAIHWVLEILLFAVVVGGGNHKSGVAAAGTCGFSAIYNFGDDNSDTGEIAAAFDNVDLPNGQTFFGKSTGRYSDGRLVIDFIAEHLGFPFLSPYLDSSGSNFSHGVNFAMAEQKVIGTSFSLGSQVLQFSQFKSRSSALYNQLSDQSAEGTLLKSILPRPDSFGNALYIIDIGQNDLEDRTAPGSITDILGNFSILVSMLHEFEGARFFWIQNVGPVGCLPKSVKSCQKENPGCELDQNGCVKDQNLLVQEFNIRLKDMISKTRATYPNATFTYVDVYTAKYNLISQAKNLGFEDPMKICCGSYNDKYIPCGQRELNGNGTIIGSTIACNEPSKYISWDGRHFTESANQLVAKSILDGSFSDPPISLEEACHKPSVN